MAFALAHPVQLGRKPAGPNIGFTIGRRQDAAGERWVVGPLDHEPEVVIDCTLLSLVKSDRSVTLPHQRCQTARVASAP
jgi:hypothetical protein